MRRNVFRSALLLTLAAGCAGPAQAPSTQGVPAAHGGAVVPLPDGRGYVELVVRPDNPKATGPAAKGRLTAYFLNREGSGPAEPAPADVAYTPQGGTPFKMTFKAGEGGFQTDPGPFAPHRELSGELAASFDGKAVSVPVVTR